MKNEFEKVWIGLNRVLTNINLILFAILTFNPIDSKKVKDKNIPLAANLVLLVFLTLALFAAIHNLNSGGPTNSSAS